MKPKVVLGSTAGVTALLVGIGGAWVITNFEMLTAKALELGAKLAVKRGVKLTPETVKLLVKLGGGVAGATAAGQKAASAGKTTASAGKATASAGKRVAGKTRPAGTKAGQRSGKSAPASRQRATPARSTSQATGRSSGAT